MGPLLDPTFPDGPPIDASSYKVGDFVRFYSHRGDERDEPIRTGEIAAICDIRGVHCAIVVTANDVEPVSFMVMRPARVQSWP